MKIDIQDLYSFVKKSARPPGQETNMPQEHVEPRDTTGTVGTLMFNLGDKLKAAGREMVTTGGTAAGTAFNENVFARIERFMQDAEQSDGLRCPLFN